MSTPSVNSALETFSFVCQYIHPSKGVLLVDNLVPPLVQILEKGPFDTIVSHFLFIFQGNFSQKACEYHGSVEKVFFKRTLFQII